MLNESCGLRNSAAARPPGGARGLDKLPATVLHIDDDPNDMELLRAAMRKSEVDCLLQHVEDVEQAMAYLSGAGVYADRTLYPLPSLVLLDLKMPRATGFEILNWIRRRTELKNLPVVVLSGSQLHADMKTAYAIGANSYFVKPLGFEELVCLMKGIGSDWLPAV